MSIDLRMPSINGTDREQLIQIRSYLYQLIPQLQWALDNVSGTAATSDAAVQAAQHKVVESTPAISNASAEATFAKLKPLIIKSSDIVQAYYEKINNMLEGIYVAESDFGVYVEQTALQLEQTSQYVNQKYSDVQTIISDEIGVVNSIVDSTASDITKLNDALKQAETAMDALKTFVMNTEAHIKTGLLDEVDGVPVFGVEVGQTHSYNGELRYTRYARFTSDRLSFFDQNDSEVAYVSNEKLYITNAEITGNLKLGGFIMDTSKGLAIKWAGRG